MSDVAIPVIEIPFQCLDSEKHVLMLYKLAFRKIKSAGLKISDVRNSKILLSRAGFSQNGRNRLIHLSEKEIAEISTFCPSDQALWNYFVGEFQVLLSKMDQVRKTDTCVGCRPYITTELAKVVSKLTRLRFFNDQGVSTLHGSKLREFLGYSNGEETIPQYTVSRYAGDELRKPSVTIQSAIRLLELYRDELITPPQLKIRKNFDEYDLHMIETRDYSWMDDGGESFIEAIRDIPFETYYDEMPQLNSVLDWFLATKPELNKNHVNRGWGYLEKLSCKWHDLLTDLGLDEESILDFPSWSCLLNDHSQEWLVSVPAENPYKIVPLVTPMQMLEETKSMHHCVVYYIESCLGGNVRIFSVRDKYNDKRVATVQLEFRFNQWEVVQLKGKCNKEMICSIFDSRDPLTAILDELVSWYNSNISG